MRDNTQGCEVKRFSSVILSWVINKTTKNTSNLTKHSCNKKKGTKHKECC